MTAPLYRTRTAPCVFSLIVLSFLVLALLPPLPLQAEDKPPAAEPPSPVDKALLQYLVCPPGGGLDTQRPLLYQPNECLAAIYLNTGKKALWVNDRGMTDNGWIVLNFLKHSRLHGLNEGKYQLEEILGLLPSRSPDDLARLDTLLSYGLVRYIHDITQGQFEPHLIDPELFAEAGALDFDPLVAVRNCLAAPNLSSYLHSLAPQHHHYTLLQEGLERYRAMEKQGEWASIPPGPTLRPGESDPRIKAVRLRLMRTDMPNTRDAELSPVFDTDLKRAVIRFQSRHSLDPDGIIGRKTLAAMNVSLSERIESIRLNMARWHWQAHDLGERYVIVNTASFHLQGIQGEEVEIDVPVIVGQSQHQTPVFSDLIRYLVFNPYWTITPSIAKNEELPELRKNPNHLVERHVRMFDSWQEDALELDSTAVDWHSVTPGQMTGFRLRQDPGPWNALGKLKFVFPNSYMVYMHGTPAQELFNRYQRNFSHGCIRVSDPPALARFILKGQNGDWTDEKLQQYYEQNERKVVVLSRPVPVHITYQTAWVDKSGTIHFNSDVYERDAKLRKALYK